MTANIVECGLAAYASPEQAKTNSWFFKTGPGQYGEGDQFIGVTVPNARKVARHFRDLPLDEAAKLLASPLHEVRLTGLLVLVDRYKHCQEQAGVSHLRSAGAYTHGREHVRHMKREMQAIVHWYLVHLDRVNNWDLVDVSAPQILGVHYLTYGGERKLYTFAKSKNLWERRIAIVATYAFIRAGRFEHTLAIAEMLLMDREDLIHKATGWMLREVGKRDRQVLDMFLASHGARMPRTMLRYAIEKHSESERTRILTDLPCWREYVAQRAL
ncbi:MAG: DNA alkylation repair protein [Candidatus Pacebacteria bacterium]|nr:DNA alkylation repair protein [Candidatus Paceibacterota bacterium]